MKSESSGALTATCLAHLKEEESTLEQLEAILVRNRQALVDHDATAMMESGEQLQLHSNTMVALGERRHRFQQTLSETLGLSPESVTIVRVVRQLDPDERQQIMDLRFRLRSTVSRLHRLLQGNLLIAMQRNLIIERTLSTLTGDLESPRYGATGQMQARRSSSLFETET